MQSRERYQDAKAPADIVVYGLKKVQGHLAHKKTPPPRTLQYHYT